MSQHQAPHAARGYGACPSSLDASTALVRAALDSSPIPARSLGRGLRPHPAAGCWGTLWRLGPPAPDGSPSARHWTDVGIVAMTWAAAERLAPHRMRDAAPLDSRPLGDSYAPLACVPRTIGLTHQTKSAAGQYACPHPTSLNNCGSLRNSKHQRATAESSAAGLVISRTRART